MLPFAAGDLIEIRTPFNADVQVSDADGKTIGWTRIVVDPLGGFPKLESRQGIVDELAAVIRGKEYLSLRLPNYGTRKDSSRNFLRVFVDPDEVEMWPAESP